MTSTISTIDKRKLFQEQLNECNAVLVAYSGGIDSTLVLKVAHDVLGKSVTAVTAVSPSLASRDLENARLVAEEMGVRHVEINSTEMENPLYQVNDLNRCYFCKTNVYERIIEYGAELEGVTIFDGTNRDDLGDHRPGLRAARENGVRSPLKEVGMGKEDIRLWAQDLGLSNWDRPSNACLSSRIPYGSEVTQEKLKQVEQAEAALYGMGFTQLRVRHHDAVARLEFSNNEIERAFQMRDSISAAIKAAGYQHIAIDINGYESGSLNQALKKKS